MGTKVIGGHVLCAGGGKNSPIESSSESKALARLSLSPSMNSKP